MFAAFVQFNGVPAQDPLSFAPAGSVPARLFLPRHGGSPLLFQALQKIASRVELGPGCAPGLLFDRQLGAPEKDLESNRFSCHDSASFNRGRRAASGTAPVNPA